jgi:hypothetical protein
MANHFIFGKVIGFRQYAWVEDEKLKIDKIKYHTSFIRFFGLHQP